MIKLVYNLNDREKIAAQFREHPEVNPISGYKTKPGKTYDALVKEFGDPMEVDIFSFEVYEKEYQFMSRYFKGVELILRTALFIDYKYNYLSSEARKVYLKAIKNKKDKAAYLRLTLDVFEPLYLLTKWFEHFNPKSQEHVKNTLDKYKNHLDVMFNRMYKARFDKDWDETTKLWFTHEDLED